MFNNKCCQYFNIMFIYRSMHFHYTM